MSEKLPIGTIVRYHGSIAEYHGDYEIVGYTDPEYLRAVKGDVVADTYYPGDLAYQLGPVGVPIKFDNRGEALFMVRPASVTKKDETPSL